MLGHVIRAIKASDYSPLPPFRQLALRSRVGVIREAAVVAREYAYDATV